MVINIFSFRLYKTMQNVQKDQDYVGELSLRLEEIVWGLDKSTRNLHFVLFFFPNVMYSIT